jgi:hypothetical protein
VLFCNPASAGRDTLTVRRSVDGARTWSAGRVVESGRAAYNDLCVVSAAGDGTPVVLCLFERGAETPYERLTLARFPPGWLDEGDEGGGAIAADLAGNATPGNVLPR